MSMSIPITFGAVIYFVDHTSRQLWWMDEFHMNRLSSWRAVAGIQSRSHVSLGLEIEYWRHCDLFPSALIISESMIQELRDIILHSTADVLTSPTTTVPFMVNHLSKMLELTDSMKLDVDKIQAYGVHVDRGTSTALARLMLQFATERFHHFHGEFSARLDKETSVYERTADKFTFTKIIFLVLFNAPMSHLKDLNAIHADDIVMQVTWVKLIAKTQMRSEWGELILHSTLILNANVALLAVPGSERSPLSQVLSYASICFGLGSIILGLLLTRQYRLEDSESMTAADAAELFKARSLSALESVAILFSLPYVFTIWGMATFLFGFLILVVQMTSRAVGCQAFGDHCYYYRRCNNCLYGNIRSILSLRGGGPNPSLPHIGITTIQKKDRASAK
ncbi:hypothetical protein C8R43DRAFT_656080 [Mycena crocata]|nr:hypothetical protein C8R43DRAFT_656080 [Mycena crocata]